MVRCGSYLILLAYMLSMCCSFSVAWSSFFCQASPGLSVIQATLVLLVSTFLSDIAPGLILHSFQPPPGLYLQTGGMEPIWVMAGMPLIHRIQAGVSAGSPSVAGVSAYRPTTGPPELGPGLPQWGSSSFPVGFFPAPVWIPSPPHDREALPPGFSLPVCGEFPGPALSVFFPLGSWVEIPPVWITQGFLRASFQQWDPQACLQAFPCRSWQPSVYHQHSITRFLGSAQSSSCMIRWEALWLPAGVVIEGNCAGWETTWPFLTCSV